MIPFHTFQTLSRTYYKRGILFHIDGTKLIYKFNTSDAEIKQRMQYYDLTQGSGNGEEAGDQVMDQTLLNSKRLNGCKEEQRVREWSDGGIDG